MAEVSVQDVYTALLKAKSAGDDKAVESLSNVLSQHFGLGITEAEKPEEGGAFKAGAKRFALGQLPVGAGLAGFEAGMAAATPIAALTGPAAPAVELGGGLLGALVGGAGMSRLQSAALAKMPEVAKALGVDPETLAKEEEAHPVATKIGEVLPQLEGFRPDLKELLTKKGLSASALNAILGGGIDVAQQQALGEDGRPIDWKSVAESAALGALLNKQTPMGRRAANVGRRLAGREPIPAPEEVVPPPRTEPPAGKKVEEVEEIEDAKPPFMEDDELAAWRKIYDEELAFREKEKGAPPSGTSTTEQPLPPSAKAEPQRAGRGVEVPVSERGPGEPGAVEAGEGRLADTGEFAKQLDEGKELGQPPLETPILRGGREDLRLQTGEPNYREMLENAKPEDLVPTNRPTIQDAHKELLKNPNFQRKEWAFRSKAPPAAEDRLGQQEWEYQLKQLLNEIEAKEKEMLDTWNKENSEYMDSTGKPIHPLKEGVKNFFNWFRKSKITDSGNRPILMYHGSPNPDIEIMEPSRVGIFASPDPEFARSFSGSKEGASIYPVYVRAEKPFDYENPEQVKQILNKVLRGSPEYTRPLSEDLDVHLKDVRRFYETLKSKIEKGDWATIETPAFQKAIRESGYDAFYIKEADVKNIGVYDKNQLKAAYGNEGSFSRLQDELLKQQGERPVGPALPPKDVQDTVNELSRGWKNAPKIVVAANRQDPIIPEDIRGRLPANTNGFYTDGTVYLLANRASSKEALRGTLFHESLGHYGLRQQFGRDLDGLLNDIYKKNAKLQELANARMEKQPELLPHVAIEELLAERAEQGPIKEFGIRSAFNRVVALVRNYLREMGLVSKYSDNDIANILRRAREAVETGTSAKQTEVYDPFNAQIRYSRTPEEQRKGDSEAVRAIGESQNVLPKPVKQITDGTMDAISKVNPSTRRGVFSFMTIHQMSDMVRDKYTNALDSMWANMNKQGASLRLDQDKIRNNLRAWNKTVSKLPAQERERAFDLLNSTTAENATDELQGVEVLDYKDPKGRFEFKVTPQDKAHPIYQEFQKLIKKYPKIKDMYQAMRVSYAEDKARVEENMQKYLTPDAYNKIIQKYSRKSLRVYMPMFRSGEYKVRFIDRNKEDGVMAFESPNARDRALQELQRAGATEIVPYNEAEFTSRGVPPTGFYADLVGMLHKKGAGKDIINSAFELFMDHMPARSVLQLGRQRKGYVGFESDPLKAYANVADRYAYRINNLEFSTKLENDYTNFVADMGQGAHWLSYKDKNGAVVRRGYEQEALRDQAAQTAAAEGARDINKYGLNINTALDMQHIVEKQMDFMRNPQFNNWASKAGYFSYAMNLGANVSSAVVDMTHLPMIVYNLLGGKYGFGKAFAAMSRAHLAYHNRNRMNADMRAALDRAYKEGVVSEHRASDLAEFKKMGSDALGIKAKVDHGMNYIFARADKYQRELTFMSAYDLASKRMSPESAFKEASRAVYDSYGSAFPKAAPSITGNGLARVALTFKRFAINRVWLLQKAFKEAFKDESPEVQQAARNTLLGYFGTAFLFAGVQGMPVVGWAQTLASAVNGIFGDKDELYDPQDKLKHAVGMWAYRGPINYALNLDVATRTGWDSMFWRDDPRRLAEVGPAAYTLEHLLGPVYSYAVNVPRAVEHINEGRLERGLELLAPRAVSNVMKGFRYGTEGATTKDGAPIVKDVNAYNTFMQVLGLSPADVIEAQEEAGVLKREEKNILTRASTLRKRFVLAAMAGDDEGRQEVLEDIRQFNMKHPGAAVRGTSLKQALTRQRIKLLQSVNGVYLKKRLRPELYREHLDDEEEEE